MVIDTLLFVWQKSSFFRDVRTNYWQYTYTQLIQKISESAGKEYQIEQALEKMEKEWEGTYYVNICVYRNTYIYLHIYICIYLFTHVFMYTYIYTYIYMYMYMFTYTYIYIYMYLLNILIYIYLYFFRYASLCGSIQGNGYRDYQGRWWH
jgi:hypothetical protein